MLNVFKSYFKKKEKYNTIEALYKENTEKRKALYQQCINKKDAQGLLAVFEIENTDPPIECPISFHKIKDVFDVFMLDKCFVANLMIYVAMNGYDYLEPLYKDYNIGYKVSGLSAHLENYISHFHMKYKRNPFSDVYYCNVFIELVRLYKEKLSKDPEELRLLDQMHYNLKKKFEIAEARREQNLQENYEKWYEALLLTTTKTELEEDA